MAKTNNAMVLDFLKKKTTQAQKRKRGVNVNKDGSVRNINGKIYVDFYYLGERVRETSGLPYNDSNLKIVRDQLDRITFGIKMGTFRFAEVFPHSKKAAYFAEKEREVFKLKYTPEVINCGEYFQQWYDLLKNSGRVTGRTLLGYKSILKMYLTPFFGKMSFGDLNLTTLNKFIVWARQQKLRGKQAGNETINKTFVPLKSICKSAALEFGWGGSYDPFAGFKKLPESDAYEKIMHFSLEEQQKLIAAITDHWKPFFKFAFATGLRQGEQIGIKPEDIDWENRLLHIRRAITRDEEGKTVEGTTKNKYSRRTIKLLDSMFEILVEQKVIYDQFKGEYFFCSPSGNRVREGNLRRRTWIPALQKAGLEIREMKQTRHTFATMALSCGESPLWISRILGHRNSEMIIKVYGKYMENAQGTVDGSILDKIIKGNKPVNGNHG